MFYYWPFMMPNLFSFMSPTTLMSVSAPGWNYTPITEWGEGDLVIEKRIKEEIATPGRQLGIIGDALVTIIGHLENPENEIDKVATGRLISLVQEIERIVAEEKTRHGSKHLYKIEPPKSKG